MIKVLKFGGTSVGSAANMRRVAEIVEREGATVTVLSAMSGTTDSLVRISAAAAAGNDPAAEIAALRDKYVRCAAELLDDPAPAMSRIGETFATIAAQTAAWREGVSDKIVVAQGELLTSALFALYLKQTGVAAELLHAPSFMTADQQGQVDTQLLRDRLSAAVDSAAGVRYVTQGFICTEVCGSLGNLGRGGSDYSAALIGAALHAGQVQIWTDIDGMHNNDPRVVEGTRPIRSMSFDEAAELAYFGAKILHPATIHPCKELGIPVLLKNTLEPSAPGTVISGDEERALDFHAVAAKDGITVVRIHSTRMLMAYGFLRKVFEVFEEFRTAIDMITTSEVAVSLTVDDDSRLEGIVERLREFGTIEIERGNTIVCVVGRCDQQRTGLAARIFEALHEVPIKMISYGASPRSVALLIDTRYKKQTLQTLNDRLF
ncbi:MAG: aspartate kinase [Rikenellaceae bacterium]|nr:aspartate kinase [Rikenellaceae bacterium]